MSNVVEVTDETYVAEVQESTIPVVIDFWAQWCGPCRMMAPFFAQLSEDPDFVGKVKFVKINTDSVHKVPAMFEVRSLPTFAVVKGTVLLDASIGIRSIAQMKQWLLNAITKDVPEVTQTKH